MRLPVAQIGSESHPTVKECKRFHLMQLVRFSADKLTQAQLGSSRCCSPASRGCRDCPDKRWIWQSARSCRPDFADERGRVQEKEPARRRALGTGAKTPYFTAISDRRLQGVQIAVPFDLPNPEYEPQPAAPQGRLNLRTLRTAAWRCGDPWPYHGCVSGCCRARSGSGCRSAG
jgi:hypothetical protein